MYRENTHANISSIYTLKCSECDVLDTNEPERLSEAVCKFWDLECVGIKNVEKSVVDSFLDTVKYDDVENAYEFRYHGNQIILDYKTTIVTPPNV